MKKIAVFFGLIILMACSSDFTEVTQNKQQSTISDQSSLAVTPLVWNPAGGFHKTQFPLSGVAGSASNGYLCIGNGVAIANLGYTGYNNLIFSQDEGYANASKPGVRFGYGNFYYDPQIGIVDDGTLRSTYNAPPMGAQSYGGGIAAGDINRDGRIDLVLLHLDAPGGQPDQFRYEVAFNTNYPAIPWSYSSNYFTDAGSVGNEANGAGVALGDIDRNGVLDLVVMGNDHPPGGPNTCRYKIGFNLDVTGSAASWTANYTPIGGMGNAASGADVALGDIDRNGTLDMLLMSYDNPTGANTFRYRIGFNLNSSGIASNWTVGYITVAGVSDLGSDAGVALGDLDGNGILDIVLCEDDPGVGNGGDSFIANEIRYKIGFNLDATGQTTDWRGAN